MARKLQSTFLKRLAVAGINVLTPLNAGVIIVYYTIRELGGHELWFIDALSYTLPCMFFPLVLFALGVLLLRRTHLMLSLIVVNAILFGLTYGHFYLPKPPIDHNGPTFTVMAYNVLFRNQHPELIAGIIKEHHPDVLGLHELAPEMAQSLEGDLAISYPYRQIEEWFGFYSRFPILDYAFFQPQDGKTSWIQRVVLDIYGTKTTILNVHPRSPPLRGVHLFGLPIGIPTGFYNQGRDTDLQEIIKLINQTDGPLIVMGDLNLTDQQSMYAHFSSRLHDAHYDRGWGMGFTFARFPDLGMAIWRIDYIFHSDELITLRTSTGDFGGSDHRPVIAELAFRELQGK